MDDGRHTGRRRRALAGAGMRRSATEHALYAADAILDYPRSGERFRGRAAIAAQRGGHPAGRHSTVQRITGGGDLWVSECVITYDDVPTCSVSIMEFSGGEVTHETQYFAVVRRPVRRAGLADRPRRADAGSRRHPGLKPAPGIWGH